MRVLLLASHAIAEHDDVQMFARMGVDVFCPGGYADPWEPSDPIRPAIPDAPRHPELAALCDEQRERHAGEPTDRAIDWAKADLHPDLLDWADAIIVHHFPERWIGGQWGRLLGRRVIWRTCGQSNPMLERYMAQFRRQGLGIVRYSPAESRHFPKLGREFWAGEDTVIRFGKDPNEWQGWHGSDAVVGNVTQDMVGRGDHCGLTYWEAATEGLPVRPAGPKSDLLRGGVGALAYDDMREYLRAVRVYLYTGTQPASYTLGLIEAMMTGTPVLSIGPANLHSPLLFEGHEIAVDWEDHAHVARDVLRRYLEAPDLEASEFARERAIDLFGLDGVMAQWREYLGC